MCLNRDLFSTYELCNASIILMGNNVICEVIGKGIVRIKIHDGIMSTLTNVKYVPNLKKNPISLDTLETLGCIYTIENGVMKVFKGALLVMKTCRFGSLYVLQRSRDLLSEVRLQFRYHLYLILISLNYGIFI